jgi:hypothetical protein
MINIVLTLFTSWLFFLSSQCVLAAPEDLAKCQQADVQLSIQMNVAYLEAITALADAKIIDLSEENLLDHYLQKFTQLQQDLQLIVLPVLKKEIAADYNVQIKELMRAIKNTLEDSAPSARLLKRYFDYVLIKFFKIRHEKPLFEGQKIEDNLAEQIKTLIDNKTQASSEVKMNCILLKLITLRQLQWIDHAQEVISLEDTDQMDIKAIVSRLFESASTVLDLLKRLAKNHDSPTVISESSRTITSMLLTCKYYTNQMINEPRLHSAQQLSAWLEILKIINVIDLAGQHYHPISSPLKRGLARTMGYLNEIYKEISSSPFYVGDQSSKLSIPANFGPLMVLTEAALLESDLTMQPVGAQNDTDLTDLMLGLQPETDLQRRLKKLQSKLKKRRQTKKQFASNERNLKNFLQISNAPTSSDHVMAIVSLVEISGPRLKKFKGDPQENMQVDSPELECLQRLPQGRNLKSTLHKMLTEEFFHFIYFNFDGPRIRSLFNNPTEFMRLWTNQLLSSHLVGEISKAASTDMILQFQSISKSFLEKRNQGQDVRIIDEQGAQDFINGEPTFDPLDKKVRELTLLMQEDMINDEIREAMTNPLVAH